MSTYNATCGPPYDTDTIMAGLVVLGYIIFYESAVFAASCIAYYKGDLF